MRNITVLLIGAVLLSAGIGAIFVVFPHQTIFTFIGGGEKEEPSVTITDHHGGIGSGGTYVVQGTAKNTGNVTVVKVYIVVTSYDGGGAEIGSMYTTLLNLDPGETAKFQVEARPYYQGSRVARYTVVPDYNAVPGL